MKKIFIPIAVAVLCSILPSQAAVVIAQYTGGEGDFGNPLIPPAAPFIYEIPKTAGQVKDISGHGFDLTASPVTPGTGPYYVDGTNTGSDYAYAFDPGSSNVLSLATPVTSALNDFSIEVTITAGSYNATHNSYVVNNGNGGTGFGILFYSADPMVTDTKVYGILNGIGFIGNGSTLTLDNTTAYTLKLENIGGVNSFYVDGVLQGSAANSAAIAAVGNFSIGGTPSGAYFSGSIDNVIVTVPEPSAAALLLVGGIAFLARRRKQVQG